MAEATTGETNTRGPRALDVDLDADLVRPADDAYGEDNEDHVPNPHFMSGTLDTSDTAGGAHQDIRETSPVFAAARADSLKMAARALDPDDDTPEELVILPEGSVTVTGTAKTPEDARQDIERAYNKMAENPVVLGAAGPEAQKAAEDTSGDEGDSGKADGPAPAQGTPGAQNTAAARRPGNVKK